MPHAIVNSKDLGDDWRPENFMVHEIRLGYWTALKDIARRRKELVRRLMLLEDEEKYVRSKIEVGS